MEYIKKNDLIAQIEHDIETGKIARPTAALMLRYVSNIPVVKTVPPEILDEINAEAIALHAAICDVTKACRKAVMGE